TFTMKTRLKQLIFLTALSVISIVFYGCFSTNFAVNKNQKFHVYECKSYKIVQNLSDSTYVFLYVPDSTSAFTSKKQYYDQTVLNMVENGLLTVKILRDIVIQNVYDYWYEFDTVQLEVTRTYSDTCKDYVEDEKGIFIEDASAKVDADGSTIHNFGFFLGDRSVVFGFDLKQMKQGHFAIRYNGFVL
ncbi:MAG: hypothetical protein ACM3RX_05980, partial [Methanococcaceae archaeon]